ncbi:amidohydrolase family protein [Lacrimispora sp. 210928-DFI.3.58]|uniref:amidohydrolase family protein n=1 Tax=Lacrimispora sp. 210928-DFI.3.58 TaxID=2883214 RepID=UPI001D060450|nr:amidohydrolase [Lacrimispora sp. 210928-DFI.3.58]MCB7321319.1 amidohydrolase [Lacrimispora sp. 210928-DFI.3.58]
MNIRFYRVKLMTMEDGTDIIHDGELWVEGKKITYAGSQRDIQGHFPPKWDREIDGKGNLLLPGFKNAHTHSAMTFLRSYADDLPLLDWLNKQVFPMEAKLQGDDIYLLCKLALMEYLTSGITANFDMYFQPRQIARSSADCGFRTVLAGALNDFVSSIEEEEENYVELNHFHPLIRYHLGFHGEYTTGKERLRGIARLAEKYKAPVFSHNSESISEVEQCIQRNGTTPTVYLDSLGIFQYGGGGYHCIHMSQEDLEIFKKRGLWAVTNPGSNVKLASGIAPVQKMMDMGIHLAIGTDGPASNNCLDMFREMFLTTGLGKLREQNAAAVEADHVLWMATVGGAHAMGLWDCDTLTAGKCADLIMIDLHQPNMQPENNLGKNLVYSGSKQNVKMTMVNGNILYENGTFYIGEEPEWIYRKANEIINKCRN